MPMTTSLDSDVAKDQATVDLLSAEVVAIQSELVDLNAEVTDTQGRTDSAQERIDSLQAIKTALTSRTSWGQARGQILQLLGDEQTEDQSEIIRLQAATDRTTQD